MIKPNSSHFLSLQKRSISPQLFTNFSQTISKQLDIEKFDLKDTQQFSFKVQTENWWYDFQSVKFNRLPFNKVDVALLLKNYELLFMDSKTEIKRKKNHFVIRQTDDILYLNNKNIISNSESLFGAPYIKSLNNLFYFSQRTDKFKIQQCYMNQIQIINDMMLILNHALRIAKKMYRFKQEGTNLPLLQ
ncbi:hypothetical protein SS50377_23481 [Spironucleus salmonicida]|nr:hypothetical protein SS50377_23481 [Spironucleus salmonicida]